MPLVALGINHKTAPVEIRERVSFAPERLPQALLELCADKTVNEAAILSTCNRTELYCGLPATGIRDIIDWLGDYHAVAANELQPYIYQHPDRQAVRHMLRVAAGLDSMVLGEPQILGQVKSAYHVANQAGTLGKQLERLFQHTFSVAKQIRTDTRIGESPVSIAFAAVSLAKQIYADFSQHTALLIGAGETIELVARHFHDHNIKQLVIANRTFERARNLAAQFDAYAIGLNEISSHLAEADIVISSTASADYVLHYEHANAALKQRKRRPVFMVDIAVPRDIDPQISQLTDVYLYTVDDLQDIIQENLRSRQAAAEQAEEIIDTQTEHFMAWLQAQDGVTSIRALREQATLIRDELLTRAVNQLQQGKEPEQVLQTLSNTLTNKLLHAPSTGLREAAQRGDADTVAILKRIYQLNHTDEPKPNDLS